MQKEMIEEKLKRFLLPILAIVVFISAPLYQNISQKYIDNSLKGAIVTYALLRTLNAGVSLVQKSSITLGVGIEGNIAVGEVLDPINDAIERFSDMVTLSIWTLGSQKALFEISKTKGVIIFVILLSILSIFFPSDFTKRVLIILILLRLFIPFSAVVSNYFDKVIFEPKIQKSMKTLEFAKNKIDSKVGNITDAYSRFKEKMSFYIDNSSKIISELINLSLTYFGKYLFELILLPLFLVYLVKNSLYNI